MEDADVLKIAMMGYGEAGGEDYDTMKMVISSAYNRLGANRPKEFGANTDEVLQKGYYAVSKNSPMYQQAVSGKFPDKLSEDKFKQSLAISSGIARGTIVPDKGHFFFKPTEVTKLKKQGKKAFNFNAVKSIGKVGKYQVYGY
jgi:hypothetical protein